MAKQVGFDRGFGKHVRYAVAHIYKHDASIVSAQHEWKRIKVEVWDLLHSPASGLRCRGHGVNDILSEFLLLVVNHDVLAGVPNCS